MSTESGGSGGVLREMLAVFGFGVDVSELKKGENALDKFAEKVKTFAEGVVAAFAVDQVYEFAESQAHVMNAIERTGTQLGITTDRVQEFQFAAKSLGLEADSLLNLMGRLQITQQAAAQGSKEQVKAFHDLGVSIKDSNGHMKAADELTLDVADGIAKISDPSKRAAVAVELFGRQGRELLPFLEQGRAGAEEYFTTFRELGGGYTEEALKAGKEFDKQQAKTNLAMTAVKNTIAKGLLPVVTAISHSVQVAAKWFNDLAKDSHIVQAALISLGAVGAGFAISMTIAFAPILAATAAIGALLLIIDDLYTFLTGGQSEIGELIDKIWGKGAQKDALVFLKNGWASITDTFHDLANYVDKVVDGMKWLTDNAVPAVSRGKTFGPQTAADAGRDAGELEAEKKRLHEQGLRDVFGDFLVDAFKWNPGGAKAKPAWDAALAPTDFTNFWGAPTVSASHFGAPAAGGNINVGDININVPPGLNEKQVGEHVAKQVGEVMKQQRREAAATVPRAGN